MPYMPSVLWQYIDRYVAEGLSFIPIPFKSKIPAIEWKSYQELAPDKDQLHKWFNGHESNLAVICGRVSGNLVVLDFDSENGFWEFYGTASDKTGLDLFDYTRISKTARGYHVWLRVKEPVKNQKYPKLDIKSDGGYIIAPPSVHPDGPTYELQNETPIRNIFSLKELGIDVNQKPEPKPQTNNQPHWVTTALMGVGEGERNNTAIKLAGYFRNLLPIEITSKLLMDWNQKNNPPLPFSTIEKTVTSAYKLTEHPNGIRNNAYIYSATGEKASLTATERAENATENATLSDAIDLWVTETKGRWFETADLDRDLGLSATTDKNNRRNHLLRLEQKGIIERHARENKRWRFVNKQLAELNYKELSVVQPLPLVLPLGLSKLVKIFPGNLIVLAGATNSGKTAVALELIRLNNDGKMPIYYFFSEGGDIELRNRLDGCEGMDISEWNMRAFSRTTNFHDVIAPDCLNVVDFLQVTNDFYSVADLLTAMCERIGQGVLIVCLQKNAGSKYGRGGSFSAEASRLYLAFDVAPGQRNCKVEIVKGKSWAIKGYNPNGLITTFHIADGWIESNEVEWHYGDQP